MTSSSPSSPKPVLFYRECAPAPAVAHLVFSFWEFTAQSDSPAPIPHEIFPDGCISLVFRRNKNLGISGFSVNELHTRSQIYPVFGGDFFWGARLNPAACARILGTDPGAIEKHICNENDAEFGIVDIALLDDFRDCRDLEDAARIFSERLAEMYIGPGDVDPKVLTAVYLIEQSGGEIRISELAGRLGLSVRQFERRFRKCAGLTPKQYARARRFRAAAVALAETGSVNWADRAAETGFADQAHLAHEFTSISGRSPRSFARKVQDIDHGRLV